MATILKSKDTMVDLEFNCNIYNHSEYMTFKDCMCIMYDLKRNELDKLVASALKSQRLDLGKFIIVVEND